DGPDASTVGPPTSPRPSQDPGGPPPVTGQVTGVVSGRGPLPPAGSGGGRAGRRRTGPARRPCAAPGSRRGPAPVRPLRPVRLPRDRPADGGGGLAPRRGARPVGPAPARAGQVPHPCAAVDG